ncbi:hypothetical protein M9H77_25569 [Catharanthus roseus]|uniref:Uncharacterized protein n=1 Tax=Catharanthus roseus TaxID=4058 RepID=A0ACC0ABA0_CATRO|nr:hypothetical protein M9H77_25569 [Catharanthus roseus]
MQIYFHSPECIFNFVAYTAFVYMCLLEKLSRFMMFLKCLKFAERNQSSNLSMAKSSFKRENTLERRTAESSLIRKKYPDRIPVIVEKAGKSDIPDIDKKKYLVPAELTVGQFVYVVRKRINLTAEKAIFVFVNDSLPATAALMSAIYEENKDEDGFLYMSYSGENTFGFSQVQ